MYLVFKAVVFNGTELQSVQNDVYMGHHKATVNKDILTADDVTQFWRGYNMFMGDFGHSSVKCKLLQQQRCSFYGASQ